ncbi:MAG TPA: 16S rRNA (uracil(1498)-N(3))-methyltransferase [Flavobacteriaceae bacterium]|nr:16S rRNA (uracil(1498)-N(3))-methyltransferase [Flavobacteriaceae bacterium]
MQLFYHPAIEAKDEKIIFDRDESKHISKVLRKKVGDVLRVTNGKGSLYTSELVEVNNQQCVADIQNREVEKPKPYKLHLAVAPTKMNDRYEWFLEKATEIGVDEITPIICERSERKKVKTDRFERILQSAMKQSLQYSLPILNKPTPFSDFIKTAENEQQFIAHCEEADKNSLKIILEPTKDVTILIGPEGDFSPSEIEMAKKKGFIPVNLGKTRLRTETAAIVACHTVALVNETPSL